MERKVFDCYSNVRQRKVDDWLWFPCNPHGKLTVPQGDSGDGKPVFILRIAALLSKGLPMPNGYRVKESQNAIYQCSEGGLADAVKPRQTAVGADCARVVFIVDSDERLTPEDERVMAYRKSGAWYWELPTTPGMETQTTGGDADE